MAVTTLPAVWKETWQHQLSPNKLCPVATCGADDYMVNGAAISNDGSRVVAGTYYQWYSGLQRKAVDGRFGLYIFDTAKPAAPTHKFEYNGDRGIYCVAMSGDGSVAAGGGMLTDGKSSPAYAPARGQIVALDVATGQVLLDTTNPVAGDPAMTDRVSSVALSEDGSVLVAVANREVYVYRRNGTGAFARPPAAVNLDFYSETIAIHPSGQWAASADQQGTVYLFDIGNAAVSTVKWVAPPASPKPGDPPVLIKFHSIAISRRSDVIAVGGLNHIFMLTRASMKANPPAPIGDYSTVGPQQESHDVKWVSVVEDGSFMTAVFNGATARDRGFLVKLAPDPHSTTLAKAWVTLLCHPPNSTSIGPSKPWRDAGHPLIDIDDPWLITVADGWPNHTAGSFFLVRSKDGVILKRFDVDPGEMNWPMQISADGTGIVGGSDNNTLYFFKP